jgi:hypothetical protein
MSLIRRTPANAGWEGREAGVAPDSRRLVNPSSQKNIYSNIRLEQETSQTSNGDQLAFSRQSEDCYLQMKTNFLGGQRPRSTTPRHGRRRLHPAYTGGRVVVRVVGSGTFGSTWLIRRRKRLDWVVSSIA